MINNHSLFMTVEFPGEKDKLQPDISININQQPEKEKILCPHCLRTATNGIKCKGICVADSDY